MMVSGQFFNARGFRGQPTVLLMVVALVICLTKIPHISGEQSPEEILEEWHTRCHPVCGVHQITYRVNAACATDPYKLPETRFIHTRSPSKYRSLFLARDTSASFLKSHKLERRGHSIKKRGIVEECCNRPRGCNWEEAGEYCRHSIRRENDRSVECPR